MFKIPSQLRSIFFLGLLFIFQSRTVDGKQELKERLFAKDHSYPLINRSHPVHVTVGIELIQILEINERNQHIRSKVWMRMFWTNENMVWDAKRENINILKVNPQKIWTPDIYLYDDVSFDISSSTLRYNTQVIIFSNGTNKWMIPIVFESSCRIHVENFPFDKQECKLKFGSWSSSREEIDIKELNLPTVTKNYVNSSEWVLFSLVSDIHNVTYECCPHPFVDITFTIKVQRKPLYYYFNILCPCFILMAVTIFSFFLPPESGERISVVITVLLSFAVFLQLLGDNLPRNSHSTPMLSVFYIAVMSESACSLICTCCVLSIYYRGSEKNASRLPCWVKKLFPQLNIDDIRYNKKAQQKHSGDTQVTQMKRRKASRALTDDNYDKCLFNNLDSGPNIDLLIDPIMKRRRTISNEPVNPLDKISHDMGTITSCIIEQTVCDEIQQEWQRLAKILDRMFLLMFLCIYLITGFIILLPGYMVHLSDQYSNEYST